MLFRYMPVAARGSSVCSASRSNNGSTLLKRSTMFWQYVLKRLHFLSSTATQSISWFSVNGIPWSTKMRRADQNLPHALPIICHSCFSVIFSRCIRGAGISFTIAPLSRMTNSRSSDLLLPDPCCAGACACKDRETKRHRIMTPTITDKSHTRFWLLPLLPLLLGLIGIIGEGLYNWIAEDFFDSLSSTIPYKRLLQITLFLLCMLVALAIYHSQKIRSLSKYIAPAIHPISPSKKETDASRIEKLHHLSSDEKELLRLHFDQDKTCLTHPEKGAVLSLSTKGVLYAPSQHYDPAPMGYDVYMQYCVSDWAWVHLKNNPKLLR